MKSKTVKSKKRKVKIKNERLPENKNKNKKEKKLIVKRVKNPSPFVRRGNNLFRDDGKIFLGEIIRQDEFHLYVRKGINSTVIYDKSLVKTMCE